VKKVARPNWQQQLVTLCVLWLAGLYLRLPVLVAPPLASLIDADLGLTQTQLGALTTIPVLMLAIGALPGSILIARLGPRVALIIALAVVALASLARGMAPPTWTLFLFTALLGLGIAVMQPALPALVLRWCPGYAVFGSAVYMNGMLMGEFIGGGLTIPLVVPLFDSDWRDVLTFWSLPGLAVALLILAHRYIGIEEYPDQQQAAAQWRLPLRDPLVWQFGIILGATSAAYFGTNAYLPAMLAHKGMPDALEQYLMLFNGMQVVGSLCMLALAGWLVGRPFAVIICAWAVLLGLLGVVTLDGFPALVATALLGLATCIQLILVVALLPLVTRPAQTAAVAAGTFMIGYLLAFVLPLAGGLIADASEMPDLILVPLIVLAIVTIPITHRSRYLTAD
jgi:MFS transporter, CP family, cyanate transporter